jgi:hypothetical protein
VLAVLAPNARLAGFKIVKTAKHGAKYQLGFLRQPRLSILAAPAVVAILPLAY